MHVHRLTLAALVLVSIGCGEPAVSVPDIPPFSQLEGDLLFGTPARAIADRPGIAVNDEGQYVEYIYSKDWLYLFEPHVENVVPKPTDRLVAVQAREAVGDTLALWSRWHSARRQLSNSLGRDPICVGLGGPLYRATRAEFGGRPALSIGAVIEFEDDGQSYDASLIIGASEDTSVPDIERGFARERVDCETLLRVVPN